MDTDEFPCFAIKFVDFHLWPVHYTIAVLEYWYCELVNGFDFVPWRKVCFQDQPRYMQVFFSN